MQGAQATKLLNPCVLCGFISSIFNTGTGRHLGSWLSPGKCALASAVWMPVPAVLLRGGEGIGPLRLET